MGNRAWRYGISVVVLALAPQLAAADRPLLPPAPPPGEQPPAAAEPPAVAEPPAAAQRNFNKQAAKLALLLAKRTFNRFRRSVAIGPMLSAAPVMSFEGDLDFQLAGGLSLYKFDIPVFPSTETIKEILEDRAKALFREQVEAVVLRGEQPTAPQLDEIAKDVWRDVQREFLLGVRPRHFEKPSFALRAEVGHTFSDEGWDVRTTASIGVGPIYVTPGLLLIVSPNVAFFLPAEISKPVVLGSGLRTPVVEPFLRIDIATHSRDENADRIFLGARFSVDAL